MSGAGLSSATVGIIVGGVVGGLCVCGLFAVVIILLLRRGGDGGGDRLDGAKDDGHDDVPMRPRAHTYQVTSHFALCFAVSMFDSSFH